MLVVDEIQTMTTCSSWALFSGGFHAVKGPPLRQGRYQAVSYSHVQNMWKSQQSGIVRLYVHSTVCEHLLSISFRALHTLCLHKILFNPPSNSIIPNSTARSSLPTTCQQLTSSSGYKLNPPAALGSHKQYHTTKPHDDLFSTRCSHAGL